MNPTAWAIIAVLVVFACVVAYNYICDLRRDLKAAREDSDLAWRLYDQTNAELCAHLGKPAQPAIADARRNPHPRPAHGFRPVAVGPNAIRDRELLREREQEQESRAPLGGIHPNDVADAAREAMGNVS